MEIKKGTEAALEFLGAALEKFHQHLSQLTSFHDVLSFALAQGYQLTRHDLDAAMEAYLDRALDADSVPPWLRQRVLVTVHA
ncbi:MAG TPA: hypothetical protein VND93_20700 [Myxococcales bacterium]|jgi:hypothetical protein|nr:hypothetical protein [Myxococcales bacterium]